MPSKRQGKQLKKGMFRKSGIINWTVTVGGSRMTLSNSEKLLYAQDIITKLLERKIVKRNAIPDSKGFFKLRLTEDMFPNMQSLDNLYDYPKDALFNTITIERKS